MKTYYIDRGTPEDKVKISNQWIMVIIGTFLALFVALNVFFIAELVILCITEP